jgi:hypothetical protein
MENGVIATPIGAGMDGIGVTARHAGALGTAARGLSIETSGITAMRVRVGAVEASMANGTTASGAATMLNTGPQTGAGAARAIGTPSGGRKRPELQDTATHAEKYRTTIRVRHASVWRHPFLDERSLLSSAL